MSPIIEKKTYQREFIENKRVETMSSNEPMIEQDKMTFQKSVLTISRHWSHPQIITSISIEGISLQTDLNSFIDALITEIGPVTWVVTDKQFKDRLNTALITVLEKIKEESIKVV
jgi:hypothetical protein